MNHNPLSDPQLQSLEARLATTPPRLAPVEQQQLLYQCAFAAGRAVGQRASRRAIQTWTSVALILALLCVGLAYRVPSHREPELARLSPNRNSAEVKRDRPTARLPIRDADDRRQISANTALDRVVELNWPQQFPSAHVGNGKSSTDSEQPVLTSRSWISLDGI